MRKINLKDIEKHKNKYIIHLGNDNIYSFSQERQAKKTLFEISTFLNKQLNSLKQKYSLLHGYYISYYFLINHSELNVLKKSFDSVLNSIELSVHRSEYTNGNYFTFYHLNSIYSNLSLIATMLQNISFQRSETSLKYEFDSIINDINLLNNQYNEFQYNQINTNTNHLKIAI
jgi:hypothetical protein